MGQYTTLNFVTHAGHVLHQDRPLAAFRSYTISSTFTQHPTRWKPTERKWDRPSRSSPTVLQPAHLGFYGSDTRHNRLVDITLTSTAGSWWKRPPQRRTPISRSCFTCSTTGERTDQGLRVRLGPPHHPRVETSPRGTYQVRTTMGPFGHTDQNTSPLTIIIRVRAIDTREPRSLRPQYGISGHLAYFGNGRFDAIDFHSFTVPGGWDSLS
jgi:hypothetical protein